MHKGARGVALEILVSCERSALRATQISELSDVRDRALANELVNGVLRWRKLLDYYLSEFSDRPLSLLSPKVRNALRLGVYQILVLGLPPYAAVDPVVRCLSRKQEKGFVNGVLRAIVRNHGHVELPSLDLDPKEYISIRYSYPNWIVDRFLTSFGLQGTIRLLKIQNQRPPLSLRVNTTKISRDQLVNIFRQRGYDARPGNLNISLQVLRGRNVKKFPGFSEGFFTVQDEGSMLVTMALNPKPGDVVWDVCAAPGGKTTHIAEAVSSMGKVIATDIDENRIKMIEESKERMGLSNIETLVLDATDAEKVKIKLQNNNLPQQFDKILVDAPCSGLGVIRRNPDLRWNRRPYDIPKMVERQKKLLESSVRFLKTGGILVYSTCTLTEEENQDLWKEFLCNHPNVVPQDPGEALLRVFDGYQLYENENLCTEEKAFCYGPGYRYILPHVHGTDGFFIAKGIKTEN